MLVRVPHCFVYSNSTRMKFRAGCYIGTTSTWRVSFTGWLPARSWSIASRV